MTHIAALVILETDHPALTDPGAERSQGAAMSAPIRAAVLAALPAQVNRVVAVMSEREARLMIHAHLMACAEVAHAIGQPVTVQ